jgi:predicted PurR-regulated permease PerM
VTLKQQVNFWALAFAGFIAFFYVFSDVLVPFLAGMALAYLLDPVADWFERRGFSRTVATLVILGLFILVVLIVLVVAIPILADQSAAFIERLPAYATRLQDVFAQFSDGRISRMLGITREELQTRIGEFAGQGAQVLGRILQELWRGGQAIVSVLSLLVITPVVAFYLLYDWDHMVDRIDSWLPRPHRETIRDLARQMDAAVAGFVRGQISVCVILGLFYGIGLSLLGLNFGLLIGVGAGLISFIPYVGSGLGLLVAGGVAVVQFWPEWPWVAAVFAVFMVGQILEGYVLQPNLVGRSVGLHPVWLMFALLAFGSLFGFAGLLIAVPAAASVGVLFRFALSQYMASPIYTGPQAKAPEAAPPVERMASGE